MDSGHTAWMLTASALVLLMTPGLAFFYGGLVRARNVISTLMYSFISMAVVSIVWVLWGYSLAFGEGSAIIGDLSLFGLSGIEIDQVEDSGIPTLLFVIFQMMFAIITPALITGAFVERFKFTTYLVFLVVWVTIVYAPVAHWVWAPEGWLFKDGALDFAGGTVVHINAGMAAVAAALLVGKRRDPGAEPHNVPYVVLGAALLWFGWFGFNAGSGLAANGQGVNAFLVTNTSAAAAALTWGIISQVQTGRMSAVGVASGAVAGLVAITPASGFRRRVRRTRHRRRRRCALLHRRLPADQDPDRRRSRGLRCTRRGRHLGRRSPPASSLRRPSEARRAPSRATRASLLPRCWQWSQRWPTRSHLRSSS